MNIQTTTRPSDMTPAQISDALARPFAFPNRAARLEDQIAKTMWACERGRKSGLPSGVSASELQARQLGVLAWVRDNGFGVSSNDASKRLGYSHRESLCAALCRFAERGLMTVVWGKSSTGHRRKEYRLTAKGLAELEAATCSTRA